MSYSPWQGGEEDVGGGGKAGRRTRSQYVADEDDEEEGYAGRRHRAKRGHAAGFLDDEAAVDSDEDEDEEGDEDGKCAYSRFVGDRFFTLFEFSGFSSLWIVDLGFLVSFQPSNS
ncbi:hypothetical protein Ancab_036155 [Ancistrocladus abbreviatus]